MPIKFVLKKNELNIQDKGLNYTKKDLFYFNIFQNDFLLKESLNIKLPGDLFETYLKQIDELKKKNVPRILPSALPLPLKVKILCLTAWSEEDFAKIFGDPLWEKPQATPFLHKQMIKDVAIQKTLVYAPETFPSSLIELKNLCGELHRLDLQIDMEDEINIEGEKSAIKIIIEMLLNSDLPVYTLKINLLNNCNINDEGAHAIGELIKSAKTIRRFDLGKNNLNELGMLSILDSLVVNNTLSYVNISAYEDNDIALSYKCAISLKNMLLANKTLTHLILKHELVGNEGAIALAEGLKGNCTLQRICLSLSTINYEGAMHIAEMLKINKTLKRVNMNYCDIEDRGIQIIFGALKHNQSLVKIKLTGNEISLESIKILTEVIKFSPLINIIY